MADHDFFPLAEMNLNASTSDSSALSFTISCSKKARMENRTVNLSFSLQDADLMIPDHVLQAIMEGLIRNAIEGGVAGSRTRGCHGSDKR